MGRFNLGSRDPTAAAVAGMKEKNDKIIVVLIDRSGQITRKHWRMATEGAWEVD